MMSTPSPHTLKKDNTLNSLKGNNKAEKTVNQSMLKKEERANLFIFTAECVFLQNKTQKQANLVVFLLLFSKI